MSRGFIPKNRDQCAATVPPRGLHRKFVACGLSPGQVPSRLAAAVVQALSLGDDLDAGMLESGSNHLPCGTAEAGDTPPDGRGPGHARAAGYLACTVLAASRASRMGLYIMAAPCLELTLA